jgi:uncharacterized protein involved in exopolysaccharide biosynthesis
MSKIKNDEITLTGIIIFIRRYVQLLWRRWYIVAAACGLLGGYFLYKAIKSIPTYEAKMTFMLSETDKSSIGAFSSLLGQFGLGGGGGGGEGNLDKIVEIAHSHRIIKTALFTKSVIGGKEDFYANHIIDQFNLHKEWATDTMGLPNFVFKRGDFELFNRTENHATNQILSTIRSKNNPLFNVSYAKLSTILSMNFKSPNEELTVSFISTVFTILGDFYVNKRTERERQTYELLKNSADSIRSEMKGKERSAARFRDFNRGLVLESEKIKGDQMQKDAQIATLAYGENIKQLAIADFALKSNTPFIQPIDVPTLPLSPVKESKRKALMLGVALGFFLSAGGIIVWDVLRKAIQEATQEIRSGELKIEN